MKLVDCKYQWPICGYIDRIPVVDISKITIAKARQYGTDLMINLISDLSIDPSNAQLKYGYCCPPFRLYYHYRDCYLGHCIGYLCKYDDPVTVSALDASIFDVKVKEDNIQTFIDYLSQLK